MSSFQTFKLGPSVLRGIAEAGFTEPRPIQHSTVPHALEGRDILGLAQTGTGKTAAFALPMIEHLLSRRSRGGRGPGALVVAPTRELASQISEEIRMLARFTRLEVATLFGGVSAASQVKALRSRPQVVVACPGRLLDLHGQGEIHLDGVEILVLDEADHMFDMGFLPDIRRIIEALPKQRQNLLFSATMPSDIRRLASRILRDPHVVDLNRSRPVETIEHGFFAVDGTEKFPLLEKLVSRDDFVSAIVFTRTKHRAKRLARQLEAAGHEAVALQGNMSQNQRERAMRGFRDRTFRILVATDIAARGIDVEQVSHVVNFDMPTTAEAYTHRIGRTGRSEREGRAFTFVTSDDQDMVFQIESRLGETIPYLGEDGKVDPAARPAEMTRSASRPKPRNGSRPARSTRPKTAKARSGGDGASRQPRAKRRRRRGPAGSRTGGEQSSAATS